MHYGTTVIYCADRDDDDNDDNDDDDDDGGGGTGGVVKCPPLIFNPGENMLATLIFVSGECVDEKVNIVHSHHDIACIHMQL